jgi:hypothetical protein
MADGREGRRVRLNCGASSRRECKSVTRCNVNYLSYTNRKNLFSFLHSLLIADICHKTMTQKYSVNAVSSRYSTFQVSEFFFL